MKFIAKFNAQQLMLYYFTHDFTLVNKDLKNLLHFLKCICTNINICNCKIILIKYLQETSLGCIPRKSFQKFVCASISFDELVINIIILFDFLFMFVRQVNLFEESSEENEIAEVYQQTNFRVMGLKVAFDLTAFYIVVSRNSYKATPNHLYCL